MSKNLTRKGLAFGALVALGASVIAGAPASAAGMADKTLVSLAPKTGTAYGVLTGSTFDLKANFADSLSGTSTRTLKFLVEDTNAISRVDADINIGTTDTAFVRTKAITGAVTTSGANATVTVTVPNHNFVTGDKVTIGGTITTDTAGNATLAVSNVAVTVIDRNTFSYPTTVTTTTTAVTNTSGTAVFAKATITAISASGTTMTATVGSTANLRTGDVVTIAGVSNELNAAQTITKVLNATQFTFTDADGPGTVSLSASSLATHTTPYSTADTALSTRKDLIENDLGARNLLPNEVTVNARKADNSYVVRSSVYANTYNTWLRLVSTSKTTQSVAVTAWMDSNGDDLIDDTEYTSEKRTIQFLAKSDITPNITYSAFKEGDSTITNKLTFTPALNGDQLAAQKAADGTTDLATAGTVKFSMTRPGSSASQDSASATWDTDTQTWSAVSANMNAGGWSITQPTSSLKVQSVKIVSNVVTVTTSITDYTAANITAHRFEVGDLVTIASSTTGAADVTNGKILSVPSSTTFTYAAAASGADVAATTQSAGTITNGALKRNLVVPGTYVATAYLYDYSLDTPALAAFAATASAAVGANTADSATIAAVGSENVASSSATAGSVRAGTKTADFVVTVVDEDKAALAGIPVSVVAVRNANPGTVKANGTTLTTSNQTITGTTDANGQFKISLENSSALAGETVTLTASAQSVSLSAFTATWEAAVYSIHDLADVNKNSSVRNRAVANGEAYSFSFLVTDQFKKVAGSDLRLVAAATGRTVSTTNVALTNGAGTLSVADGSIGTGTQTTVAVSFQKLTGTAWADVDSATYVDWAQAHNNDLAPVVINYVTGTDTLTLNADASDLPGGTTADFKAVVAAKALKAVDLRTSTDVATTYLASEKAVVSGRVLAANGVAKSGVKLTVTGTGLLFNVGDVWALGSITFTSNDGLFAVNVYSATSGSKVVTVADGAVTKTATLVYTGTNTSTKTLTISGAQKVVPGSTLQANILLVDGNGNGVDTTAPATTPAAAYIKVSYDGPGLLSGSALPVETDSDGKASVRYLLGTGDRGTATVTVKYDQNYDGDFVDATDIIVVRNYVIGVSAKITKAATSSAVVKNAAGATIKVVRGTKSTTKVATSNSQKVTVKGGSGTVKVYVNGVKVASK